MFGPKTLKKAYFSKIGQLVSSFIFILQWIIVQISGLFGCFQINLKKKNHISFISWPQKEKRNSN